MREKATHVYTDIHPSSWSADQRPPLTVTPAGRLAVIPTLDELLSRSGTKGLQLTLDELTHHHFMLHGYEWRYLGGTVRLNQQAYFIHFGGTVAQPDVHHLGKYRQALDFLIDYAKTGRPNDALRRMR
jgi:hypothetical protein